MNWYTFAKDELRVSVQLYINMFEVTDDVLDDIERIINRHWDGSQYHSVAHMFSVASTALKIADYAHLTPLERVALFIAGCFHDAGRRDINDKINVRIASQIALEYVNKALTMSDTDKSHLSSLVESAIKATVYTPNSRKIPSTEVGKILRDADYLSAVTLPEGKIFEEASQALYDEMGVRVTYDFIRSQGVTHRSSKHFAEHDLNFDTELHCKD